MGSVSLMDDAVRGHAVAHKRLVVGHSAAHRHFKEEFRVLSGLLHPNLVRVYELGEDAGGLYFTMEAVEGVSLDEWVRVRDPLPALQHVLPQILDALAFIHAHGVVHRDLKPHNVLVNHDGIAKLVDFGVLGRMQAGAAERERAIVVGTPGYMPPEQIRGEPPEPANDLYALGCMLFELITGRPVFEGTRAEQLEAHGNCLPPRLSEVFPSAPPLFDQVCRDLLDKLAHRRPTAADLRRRLEGTLAAPQDGRLPRPRSLRGLVGRESLLESLRECWRENPWLLVLCGPNGVGKSALAEHLAVDLERDGHLVLRSRPRPTERVAYNAIDGAVDDLARVLSRRDTLRTDVVAAVGTARQIFPALTTSGFPANERDKELVRLRLFGKRAAPVRAVVFDALHRLMQDAAGTGGRVTLVIDDFQWADSDSLLLLSHLGAATDDRTTVIATLRDDLGETAADGWLKKQKRSTRTRVPPLEAESVLEIVERTARSAGHIPSRQEVSEAASRCDGRPMLAEVAGHALALTGRPNLHGLIARRTDIERKVLALLVAADDWTTLPAIASVMGEPLGVVDQAVAAMADDGFVRRGGHARIDSEVDIYHDLVRRTALEVLEKSLPWCHHAWAEYWLGIRTAPPERCVRHLLGAGRTVEAARLAEPAAKAAAKRGAYALAAEMYAIALLDSVRERGPLLRARAEALERVGAYVQAAETWAEYAALAPVGERADLALSEAHALIAGNEVARGLERLDRALAQSGDQNTQARGPGALLTAATFLLGPSGRHARRALGYLAPRARGRRVGRTSPQRDVKLGILLSFIDPPNGIRYLLRACDGYARARARQEEAQCHYMFVALALIGSRHERVRLADAYEARAQQLAGAEPSQENRAMAGFVAGLRALRRGDWARSRDVLQQASTDFDRVGASSERLMATSWGTMADAYRQDLPAMRRHLVWFRKNLKELDSALVAAHVELLASYVSYLEGNFDEAREQVDGIVRMYAGDHSNVQRSGALLYRHLPDLYADRGDGPRREFAIAMQQVAACRFFATTYAGPFAMIGAHLEAGALRRGSLGAQPRRAEWFARRIDNCPPLVAGSSDRARAYVADAASRPELALRLLERAESVAQRFGRQVDAAIASYQLGLRLGGDQGRSLCDGARDLVCSMGVGQQLLEEDPGLR